jgi:putative tryptophan/tyrosine transport system substrate-binding protein
MKRRTVWLATTAAALGAELAMPHAHGQTGKTLRRVGVLLFSAGAGSSASQVLIEVLQQNGFVDGRDIVVDARSADGRTEGLARLAAELAALKPAVIVAYGPEATQAALAASPDVPMVALLNEFVEVGLAATLARPGGRVTGVSVLNTTLNAKRLQLLSELLPKGSAVLNLGFPGAVSLTRVDGIAATASTLGLVSHAATASTPLEIDAAFATASRLRVAGVNVLGSPFLHGQRMRMIELAAKARLPAIYEWPITAREGGLMAYGPSLSAMSHQLATYVVRILNGAKAGDLPIEQPTRFELVINLKTAKALGLAIPKALLMRADEVIQ